MQQDHQYYMEECLQLANVALSAGDPPVGAVVVIGGQVVGRGIECGKSTGDITNHAEILAVKDAIRNGYKKELDLSKLYTTHEPCIMCAYLIRHYRIAEVIYGVAVPFIGGATSDFKILSTLDVPKWGNGPKITSGICSKDCEALNEAFALSTKL